MVTPGKISYEAVSTLDIFPTLLDISGYGTSGMVLNHSFTTIEKLSILVELHRCAYTWIY